MTRIAILDFALCDPSSTNYACIRSCPLVNDKKNPKPNVIKVRKGTTKPVINQRLNLVCICKQIRCQLRSSI
ncbi:MAG: hypothetical protein ACE5OZ_13190 [Candidatus Heimdallarchaeota archaeon]